jgi:putative protease
MESFRAACNAGADAVYLGLDRFSARANAENFGLDELGAVIDQSRLFGMRVYLALNTLVYDHETEQVEYIINSVASRARGVDAVIVQDLAVAELAKRAGIPIHASTQMTVTTVEGARLLKSLGFKRVVLARELSREQIRRIVSESGIEVEVFVHGAHCVSVSGQCYMSAFLGGRSGNRGSCAQPCRLDYRDENGGNFALSLKDLSLIPHISELREMGVTSCKIEGRMKRPEYVACAVDACRAALDGETPDMELLRGVFSRSGFTDGYYIGDYSDMQGVRTKEDVLASDKASEQVRSLFRKPRKRCKIDFRVRITADSTACTVTARGLTVQVVGDVPEKAVNRSITADLVKQQFGKLGGTIFEAGITDVEVDADLSLTVSQINNLRRESIQRISKEIIENANTSP